MIKINLLPIRAARKREYVKQQLILFVVLIVGAFMGLYMWYAAMAGSIEDEKKDIEQIKQKIEQYRKAIGQVEEYKGLEAKFKKKLKIIENLIKGKTGPVRVLDRLSQVIPKQVWLMSWSEKNGSVSLEGEALSLDYVARFMTNLEEAIETSSAPSGAVADAKAKKPAGSRYFTGISLEGTELEKDSKYGQAFVKFKISMKITYAI